MAHGPQKVTTQWQAYFVHLLSRTRLFWARMLYAGKSACLLRVNTHRQRFVYIENKAFSQGVRITCWS